MPTVLLPLQPGTLPANACYNTEQARLIAFAEALRAVLSGQSYYNYGSSTPDPSNNAYPWLRTTDGIWYIYSGDWISPVGPEYDLNIRRLWVGSGPDLATYDGGDGGSASDRSGPMWEVDHDFDGRSPMGPGDVPTTNPAKTLSVDENYGVGAHTLAGANIPEHRHAMKFSDTTSGSTYPQIGTGSTDDRQFFTEMAGSAAPTPINNVHPVRGCYIIRWTGRAFRRV
jgi:hypothetical protein